MSLNDFTAPNTSALTWDPPSANDVRDDLITELERALARIRGNHGRRIVEIPPRHTKTWLYSEISQAEAVFRANVRSAHVHARWRAARSLYRALGFRR